MAPSDEWRQREREKTTEVTQELCAGADEHKSEGDSDKYSVSSLRRSPDGARARCGELQRCLAPGWSYGGANEDGATLWQVAAAGAASTRETETLAHRRARRPYANPLGLAWSPCELWHQAELSANTMSGS